MSRAIPAIAVRDRPAPAVVEFADRGLGFDLQTDGNRTLADAARLLLQTTVGQPGVRTGTHPVRGLLHLPDHGLWCYVVQGRGGLFGSAGTCQFVFADAAAWHPGDLWLWCAARCGTGLFRPDGPGTDLLAGGDRRVAAEVLRGIADGVARIGLGADPRAAEQTLGGLLPALPGDVVARYAWTTCLLAKPASAAQPVVGGGWPADLRAADRGAAAAIDSWLGDRRPLPGGVPLMMQGRRQRAVDVLAELVSVGAVRLRVPDGVTDLSGLLDTVAAERLPLDDDQIGGLLDSATALDRLETATDRVSGWAARHPQDARRHVALGTGSVTVRSALLDGLWTAALDGRDELHLPPAAEPERGWHERLAQAILDRRADPAAVAADLAELRHAGIALTSDDDLTQARRWLLSLGLSDDVDPDLFPDTLDAVRHRFAATGRLGPDDRAALLDRARRDPVRAVLTFAPHAGSHGPEAAAELYRVLDAAERPDGAAALTAALLASPPGASEFIGLLDAVPDEHARRAVARQGLRLVSDGSPLPDDVLRRCAEVVAGDPATDPEYRVLLRRLALEPAARTTGGPATGWQGSRRPESRRVASDHARTATPRYGLRRAIGLGLVLVAAAALVLALTPFGFRSMSTAPAPAGPSVTAGADAAAVADANAAEKDAAQKEAAVGPSQQTANEAWVTLGKARAKAELSKPTARPSAENAVVEAQAFADEQQGKANRAREAARAARITAEQARAAAGQAPGPTPPALQGGGGT